MTLDKKREELRVIENNSFDQEPQLLQITERRAVPEVTTSLRRK